NIPSCGYVSRSGINSILIATIESAVKHNRDKSEKIKTLEDNEELLNLFLEFCPGYVFFKDHNVKTLKLSKNYEKMLGMPIDQLLGKTMFELFPSDLAKSMDADDRAILEKGIPFEIEEELNDRFYTTTKFPIIRKNAPPLLAGFSLDITRRVEEEKKLLDLRNFLSNIIDSMPSMLIAVDIKVCVTQWNIEAQHRTGIKAEDAIGQPLEKVIPRLAIDEELVLKAISTGIKQIDHKKTYNIENRLIYEDVTIYPLTNKGIKGAVIRVDDITDKVQLDELIVQSEKMLSVGGLAAGMAHEINNPLAGMIQTAEVMSGRLWERLDLPANKDAAEKVGLDLDVLKRFMELRDIPRMFNTLTESAMRIAKIVNNMLSFARIGSGEVLLYKLDNLLDKTLDLALTDSDFKKITIIKEYGKNLPQIPCEESKIQQVLLNLFRNGSKAMEEAGIENPRFIIRTKYDKSKNSALIEIEDNGLGIEEEVRKHIFEPFFTTKPPGSGVGLGLSVSYFIITGIHKGEMFVESKPGRGAMFSILLPVTYALS
ncbi:MAG: PAS domain S-box protein, partial [Spirochaetaceae bacterium]|nr:PAS domain S-box protein [Spirochaetaceae bacterium]